MFTSVRSLVLLVSWLLGAVHAGGNVGCLFSKKLCLEEEACFDDNAFGRCHRPFDSEQDFYQHQMDHETLKLLEKEISRLVIGGYRWNHEYTQCVIQGILFARRHYLSYDPGLCARMMQLTLPTVPDEVIEELRDIKPDDMAFIKFTPSTSQSYPVYADELFIPPIFRDEDLLNKKRSTIKAAQKRNMTPYKNRISPLPGESDESFVLRYIMELAKDTDSFEKEPPEVSDRFPNDELPVIKTDLSSDLDHRPAFSEGGVEWLNVDESNENKGDSDGILASFDKPEESEDALLLKELMDRKDEEFIRGENPWSLRGSALDLMGEPKTDEGQWAKREDWLDEDYAPFMPRDASIFHRPVRYDTKKPGPGYYVHESDSGELLDKDQMAAAPDKTLLIQLLKSAGKKQLNGMSTVGDRSNGDTSAVADVQDDELALKDLVPAEQLNFSTPPVALATDPGMLLPEEKLDGQVADEYEDEIPESDIQDKRNYFKPQEEPVGAPSMQYQSQEQAPEVAKTGEGLKGQFETVDATHAYLILNEAPASYKEAENLVNSLEQKLHLPRGTFSNIRLDKKQVTFKVNPNPLNLNASDVASKAEDLAADKKFGSGISVVAAGIGDKVKFEVVSKSSDRRLFILTFVLCGAVVGVLTAVGVVYVVRRHARSRQKLQSLAQPETEASQDYQDLCRQRMASKTSDKPEPTHVAQSPKRIRSLSQSEGVQHQSSSSHSSTSSWNEEPVTSNMDISTGHMILSYMEDHLKNKDRLDREWEALCAYEAEPCSTAAASQPQNIKKNRYTDVLPYDHSRVVLNDLSNVSGSDYINASTITDHDPRNPAYIATQGPLPHTAADFWQMIWEQGSVVMVMLTRLMENGVAMCHRYWPEEGSEVYHIYEVHLVSEHIWCDDYLVRSFYLKNLKTSETRTVTQFHFLSWPDNGVPSSTKALLEFRRKVNKSYRGRSCPIVVHCSDGIGRTGTYCLIDMVLNRMAKGAKEIDIAATLEHIRDQRGGMVKTKAQFEFVLMAVAEEVHAILKALSQ